VVNGTQLTIKAKEKYESDCLKLNSYTANAALSQGKELEKIQAKLERVRQTIGGNEQDFRQFVKVLEGTTQKWETEWRGFCDVSFSVRDPGPS
jgi:prophage DNA circulation protein